MGRGIFATTTSELIPGTEEQELIWETVLAGEKHVIVDAGAGTGKTFTIEQLAKRVDPEVRVGLVAFNVHIKQELKNRVGNRRNVHVMTYHGLGYRTVMEAFPGVQIDEHKVWKMLDDMTWPRTTRKEEKDKAKAPIRKLVSLAKSYGLDQETENDELFILADEQGIDLTGRDELIFDQARKVLELCQKPDGFIDFDDQVWLPMQLGLEPPRYDLLCVDEYQDTGITQQWLAIHAGIQICAVGDPRQAIYQFRGADSSGFERLRTYLDPHVVTLPLTLTRRCPKLHVQLANRIAPKLRALPDAVNGSIEVLPKKQALNEMQPGDMVLCRVNADLINFAYKLIELGKPAKVRGRNIGEGLIALVEKAEQKHAKTVADVIQTATILTKDAVNKFIAMGPAGEMRIVQANDRLHCLCEIAIACPTIEILKTMIAKLFSDEREANSVLLSTVHRGKGLEANTVWILRPDLLPHPMSKKRNGHEAEQNLGYVAVTRSKNRLVFIDQEAPMFPFPMQPVKFSSPTLEDAEAKLGIYEVDFNELERRMLAEQSAADFELLSLHLDSTEQKHAESTETDNPDGWDDF